MKNSKLNQILIAFLFFCGASAFAQITPENAYGKSSTMVANQGFDAEANSTFKFDIEVRGTFKYGNKSDKFLYYLNSADGSMFFPENVSPLAAQQTNDQHFDGMLIDPNGVVHQYWTDTDDNTKTVTTMNFFGASPVTGNPNAFQAFLENADKSPGTVHGRFGSTTVYKGNSGGKQIKMTIANPGNAVAMNPDAIGLMAPIFKDHKQKIVRVTTRFEFNNMIIGIDDVRQVDTKKHSAFSYTLSGYKKMGASIDLPKIIENDPHAYKNIAKQYLVETQMISSKIRDAENDYNRCLDDNCRSGYQTEIQQLKVQLRMKQDEFKSRLKSLGIQDVYNEEDD